RSSPRRARSRRYAPARPGSGSRATADQGVACDADLEDAAAWPPRPSQPESDTAPAVFLRFDCVLESGISAEGVEVLALRGPRPHLGIDLEAAEEVLDGGLALARKRLEAREIVEQGRMVRQLGQAFAHDRGGALVVACRVALDRRRDPLPGGGLEGLAPGPAQGEDHGSVLVRHRLPLRGRVADEDEGPGGTVDRVAADGERRASGDDDVELLLGARTSGPGFVVLLDHE